MVSLNEIIACNIREQMSLHDVSKEELAKSIGVSNREMNKLLFGTKLIDAVRLRKIADVLGVETAILTAGSNQYRETDPVSNLIEKVSSKEAKEAIRTAGELADMIIFHSTVRENGEVMGKPWEM